MFQIYDGSMEFTQWDQGQKVTCDRMDAGDKVVFINFSGATYVMEAYAEGGVIVADVPNKLLQYASPIVIDLQDQPCQYTRIGVNASEKPEDYEFVDNAWVEKEDRPASGGGGATPDWNQNDETAPDYIKNRPFYESEERKTVYPITELEAGDYEGAWMANIPEYLDVKIGDDVVINFNGVEYKRTALESFGSPYVGNPVCAGAPEHMDSGEPFCIMFFLENVAVYVDKTVTTCKVGIFQTKTEVKKLDSKFIDGTLVVNTVYDEATDTVSADKTYDEIEEAAKTKTVVLNADGDISYLTQAYDGEAVFVQPFFTYNLSNDSYTTFDSWAVTRIKADGTVKNDQI